MATGCDFLLLVRGDNIAPDVPPLGAVADEAPLPAEVPDAADASAAAGAVTGDTVTAASMEQEAAAVTAPEVTAPAEGLKGQPGPDPAPAPGSHPRAKGAPALTVAQPERAAAPPPLSAPRAKRGQRRPKSENGSAPPAAAAAAPQQPQGPAAPRRPQAEDPAMPLDEPVPPAQPLTSAAETAAEGCEAADAAAVAAGAESVPPSPARAPPSAKGKRTRSRHAPTRFLPTFAPDRPAQRRAAGGLAADGDPEAAQATDAQPTASFVPHASQARPDFGEDLGPAAGAASIAAAAQKQGSLSHSSAVSSGAVSSGAVKRCVCYWHPIPRLFAANCLCRCIDHANAVFLAAASLSPECAPHRAAVVLTPG